MSARPITPKRISRPRPAPLMRPRPGFTLVELMVAITIIAILAAIAVPAVMRVITQGRNTAIRMEISSLDDAVNKYQQKYGSFPPDGSNWSVMERHMRRAFPRMSQPDLTLLTSLTHPGGTFSPVAMDRAEALLFFLGGFSSDEAHPLTGQGGPLEYVGDGSSSQPVTDLAYYQYNATRDNAFFDFEPQRMPLDRIGGRWVSMDETNFGTADTAHGGAADLLPVYLVDGGTAPIIYFDSRTYGDLGGGAYNGFLLPTDAGGCRPYKTGFDNDEPVGGSSYGSVSAAFDAVKFKNPDSFQIISPGRDGIYGSIVTAGGLPVHFVVETGKAVIPNENATNYAQLQYDNIDGFQETGSTASPASENGQFDNITNFSGTTLVNDLAE